MRHHTCDALDTLLHALGWTDRRADIAAPPTRNHLVTDEPGADYAELLAAGLLEERRAPGFLDVGDRVFAATMEGRRIAAIEWRRRFPPLTRGQQRYQRWLNISDVCPDLTFGQFLRKEREMVNG